VDIVVDNEGKLTDDSKKAETAQTRKFIQPGMPVYRVQIIASGQTFDVESKYPAISDLVKKYGVNVEKVAGLNKYQIGNFASFEEADNLRVLLKAKGFKDCFVVVLNK
jgi:adenine-specific DNA methylase